MKKITISLFLLFFSVIAVAQIDNMKKAEKLLNFVTSGWGDSIYECLNDKARQAIPKEMLGGLMKQLEPIYGKYCSHDKWQIKEMAGATVYHCNVHFDKGILCFLTAFDSDGKTNTLRFIPAELKTEMEDLPAAISERHIVVEDGIYKLPGILTYPKGRTNVPIAVLIHGSGPNDKDETVGANRPFLDLAWGLAQRGVAVLRYDKRTKVYGDKYISEGEVADLDHETVDDAVAAVALAMKQSGIDKKRVYVIGHSLGAMLAPRIALRIKGLGGLIMMAAPARPLEDVMVEQVIYLSSQGVPNSQDIEKIEMMKRRAENVKKIGTPAYDEKVGLPFDLPLSYWKDLNDYDQVKTAGKLSIPIFIMQGVRDYQVKMIDFALWKRRLGNSRRIRYKSYPLLNHLFMEGTGTSTPAEYMTAKHIPAYVMDDIVKFIDYKSIN